MGKFAFKIPTTGKNYNERDKNTQKLNEKENKRIKKPNKSPKEQLDCTFLYFYFKYLMASQRIPLVTL